MAKYFAAASLLVAAAMGDRVDDLLSGVCPFCQEAPMTPGYCNFCDGYYDMHSRDMEECHDRVVRFTTSDTCVEVRVMEARAERAAEDAKKQQRKDEKRDDELKEQAAADAEQAAEDAHQT